MLDAYDVEDPQGPKSRRTGHAQYDRIAGAYESVLRKCFLRRVYGILSVQLALTVAVCGLCMFYEPLATFMTSNGAGIVRLMMIPGFGLLIAMAVWKNKHPINIVLLMLFTVTQSCMIGSVCALYAKSGMSHVIIETAGLTMAVFIGLTVFTLQSKIDFSFLRSFLMAGLFVVLGWGLITAIVGWTPSTLWSLFSAILFCGFILFDTYMLSQRLGYDEYVVAALELYLDILNLFLALLRSRRDD